MILALSFFMVMECFLLIWKNYTDRFIMIPAVMLSAMILCDRILKDILVKTNRNIF